MTNLSPLANGHRGAARIFASAARSLRLGRATLLLIVISLAIASASAQNSTAASANAPASGSGLEISRAPDAIWENGVGNGFRDGANSITVGGGATYGLKAFGSKEAHDLVLGSLVYGHVLGPVRADRHWYRGNLEFRAEVWGGEQFSPSHEWIFGFTPHLRYNIATETRLIPFLDLGAGVTGTGIRGPDLGGPFQFNLQAGAGVRWFFRDSISLDLEARYLHVSSARIYKPNLGLNGVTGMLGLSIFF